MVYRRLRFYRTRMATRFQETTAQETPQTSNQVDVVETPQTSTDAPAAKKIKMWVPKIQPRIVGTAESHWEKLPTETQNKILDMEARQTHREKLAKVCADLEEFLLIQRCFVCKKEEWGIQSTPCCQKPAHFECCTAPIHVNEGLRRVCMILDIEAYILNKGNQTIVRELGWCDMDRRSDSIHFQSPVSFSSLSEADKRTANYVIFNIHSLPFHARPEENAVDQNLLDFVMKTVYKTLSSLERDVVAYKGGTLEKQLLSRLNIPYVNLEEFNCPKVNQLLFDGFEPLFDCACHIYSHCHCPRVETRLFYQWLTVHS